MRDQSELRESLDRFRTLAENIYSGIYSNQATLTKPELDALLPEIAELVLEITQVGQRDPSLEKEAEIVNEIVLACAQAIHQLRRGEPILEIPIRLAHDASRFRTNPN
jgi:hypothetical protein